MRSPSFTRQFQKDVQRMLKRGKEGDRLRYEQHLFFSNL